MNRFLAETLSVLNVVIAIVLVLVGAAIGWRLTGNLVGTLSGLFVGFTFAALTGGIVAYLALIERHLAKIAASPNKDRVEPRL
jgi:hypothetical protein